jgi:hypothetical protein
MKIRLGFVSNSSSSSFVIWALGTKKIVPCFDPDLMDWNKALKKCKIPQTFGGDCEFGWDRTTYSGFASKLNWAILQAQGIHKYEKMISNVLEKNFPAFTTKHENDFCFINNFADDWVQEPESDKVYGYIDHQSHINESHGNADIFKTEKVLEQFLFNPDHYIQGDNDNG